MHCSMPLPISDRKASSRGVVSIHNWNTPHTSECTNVAIIVLYIEQVKIQILLHYA